jgi:hypothetical protein
MNDPTLFDAPAKRPGAPDQPGRADGPRSPTAQRPYWHDNTGNRVALGEVLAGAHTPEEHAYITQRHADAIRALMHDALTARTERDSATCRRLAIACSRLCQEATGWWGAHTGAPLR